MKLRLCFLIILLSLFISICAQELPAEEIHMVEMRDGIKLATKVYRPSGGDGPWPVILALSQYGKGNRQESENVLSKRIARVVQDVRGTGGSEGHYDMMASNGWGEKQDGYDTVEWILAQPWCNGKIVTYGGSALGMTQILLAGTGSKGIVGQLIDVACIGNDLCCYTGGVLRKLFVESVTGWYRDKVQTLNTVRSHYTYDDYWKTQNLSERADRVNWPVVLKTGWYDIYHQGAIDAFNAIQSNGGPKARDNVHILIGPWGHEGSCGAFKYPQESWKDEWPYRFKAQWPYQEIDYWLLDTPAPDDIPTIKYFTMGEYPVGNSPGNEWGTSKIWPPEDSKLVPFYLHTDGNLQRTKSDPSQLSYEYDPRKPVPTNGGQVIFISAGAYDQRVSEKRDDVIIFSTPPLKEPVEVTGRMTAVLYVSTSAVDTDFTAQITDVYPDGRSMILTHGIRRLSFRNSYEKHELAIPGEIYRLEIDLQSTSMVFNTGHQIRVAISSSNSPWFEPNPNTGIPNDSISNAVNATQTIYLGGENASYINLPIRETASYVGDYYLY